MRTTGSARHGARRRSTVRRRRLPSQGRRIGKAIASAASSLTVLAAVVAAGQGLGPGLSGGRAVLDMSNTAADLPRQGADRGSRGSVREPFPEDEQPTSDPSGSGSGKHKDKDEKIVIVPRSGSGKTRTADGGTDPFGSGEPVRYRVEVEKDLPFRPDKVAEVVDSTLRDERSWAPNGQGTFQRVDDDTATLRIVIATPETTDDLCYPLDTGGKVSCRIYPGEGELDRVVLNADRWAFGADSYGDDVTNYRRYVVNHEVGHALGHGHASCSGSGDPAPVMVQQTKSVGDCDPNPWPLGSELH